MQDTHTPHIFPLAFFRKNTRTEKSAMKWPAKSIAAPLLVTTDKERKAWYENEDIIIVDANKQFTTYNHKEHLRTKRILFTHLGGGIGDLIAFSSVAEFLQHKTLIIHCDPRHFGIFKWFSNQTLRYKGFHDVIVPDYTPANRLTRYSTYARLQMEWAAIDARERNWYDAMFERIGLQGAPKGFDRPHLVRRTDTESVIIPKKSVIISHRASCQMRSSRFEDFYWPVKNALPGYRIYVHQVDLSPEDLGFLIENNLQDVGIIERSSMDDYISNLYAAEMVVCTDTAAIHFREGVQKPCLAAFSAISMQSRTSGYRHTRSFNVKTTCEHQPCFIHERMKGQVCHAAKKGDITAPCQVGESFQDQLYRELKDYRP